MAFPPALKMKIKKLADFKCCVCYAVGGVDIHHIIPQAENGPDTADNAAPLCPSCHDRFGHNPNKRSYIKEVRNHWYEKCKSNVDILSSHLDAVIKKNMDAALQKYLDALLQNNIGRIALNKDVLDLQQMSGISKGTNPSINSNNKPPVDVPIEKYIQHLYEFDYGNKQDLYDILFDSRAWYESGDDEYILLDKRKRFLSLFGSETARRLCLKVQTELNFDPRAFSEEYFAKLISRIHLEVLLILWNEKYSDEEGFSLKCVISENGNYAWRKNPN